MRKLIVSEFISLDGVIQAPGGADEDTDGGFAHGGWTHPYWDDAIGEEFGVAFGESDAFLLGRRTWEGHGAAFDPMPEGDSFGDPMKAIQKYVVSNTLTSTDLWRNSTLIKGDVVEQVRALKAQPGKNILLDGSSQLAHTLIQHDLVDEYRLLVYPLVLGGGKKLFPEGRRVNLRLVEVKPFASGVTLMRYVPDRPE
jgi:dihydrofolate reductase